MIIAPSMMPALPRIHTTTSRPTPSPTPSSCRRPSVFCAVVFPFAMPIPRARPVDDDEPGVQDGGDPAEEEQDDVDEEVRAAAGSEEHDEGWDEDGDYAECEAAQHHHSSTCVLFSVCVWIMLSSLGIQDGCSTRLR